MSIWHPDLQPEWVSVFFSLSLSLYIILRFHVFLRKQKSLDWRTVPRSRLYVTQIPEKSSRDLFVMETSEISARLLAQFWGDLILVTRRAAINHLCHQKWCNLREQWSWQRFASRLMEYGGGFSDASNQETIAKSGKLAWHQNELSKMKWNCKHCEHGRTKKRSWASSCSHRQENKR